MEKKKDPESELTIEIDPFNSFYKISTSCFYYDDEEVSSLQNFDIKIYTSHIDGDDFDSKEAEKTMPAFRHYKDSGVFEMDEGMNYLLVGRAKAYLGNFEDYGVEPTEVLDYEETTSDFRELYEDEQFCEDVAGPDFDDFEMIFSTNILIIDRIEVLPYFRGQYLGLTTLVKLSKTLKLSAKIIALKPYPMQTYPNQDSFSHPYWNSAWVEAMQKPKFINKTEWKKDKMRLTNYYKKANFRSIRKGEFMITGEARLDGKIEKKIIGNHLAKIKERRNRFERRF